MHVVWPDGSSEGLVDKELAKKGLSRRVFAVIPYYLLASYLLQSSELVVTVSEGALRNFIRNDRVKLFAPPLDLPDIPVSMVYGRDLADDPAQVWFRSVIEKSYESEAKDHFFIGTKERLRSHI